VDRPKCLLDGFQPIVMNVKEGYLAAIEARTAVAYFAVG
jgi:hypothetical protein